jgi:hypothetical protein
MGKVEVELKDVFDALVCALQQREIRFIIRRLIIEEFVAALNKRKIVSNEEYQYWREYAITKATQ